MQDYDYPAKNRVRSWFFAAIDRFLGKPGKDPRHALYLPAVQDLEGPLYKERGITTHPVEREEAFIAKMAKPLRERIFHGTVVEWIASHADASGARLGMANLDYEGRLNTFAPEIVSLFRIFPSRRGGVLGLTTFANIDPESVKSGVVHANTFDSLLEGQVRRELHGLYNQLRPYLESRDHPDAVAHAQFSRDFGVLWRVLMGLSLWDSPTEGAGVFRTELHRDLAVVLGEMHREVERIRTLGSHHAFTFVHEPRAAHALHSISTPLFPLCLERVLYRSRANNRMSTWIIFFGRLHTVIPVTEVAQQLWQLYSRSPLTYVSPSGRMHTYLPR